MNEEVLTKESQKKRDEKFKRVVVISVLLATGGGIVISLFNGDIEIAVMALLLYILTFQLFIYIWVFRLHYHLVPTCPKDDDDSMKLEDMD